MLRVKSPNILSRPMKACMSQINGGPCLLRLSGGKTSHFTIACRRHSLSGVKLYLRYRTILRATSRSDPPFIAAALLYSRRAWRFGANACP